VAALRCRCTRFVAALRSTLPALVVCIGVISLIHDSWLVPLPHRGNLHLLFGFLLCLCVAEQFRARLSLAPRMPITDLRPLSRHLSRLVYLLLYGLMLLRLIIAACAAPQYASVHGPDDFQSYLFCGILALVTIHLLAACCRRFVIPAAETPLSLFLSHALQANGLRGTGLQRNGRLT